VARENLGELPAQVAAAALLTDYVLTVAVSVSSGVAQVASAFPVLLPHRVGLAIACLVVIMLVNLRGVRESGAIFAVPSYFFLLMISTTVAVAFWRTLSGTLGGVPDPPHLEAAEALQPVGAFLILHAFSSGTSAMTGVEAIANGTTAFKEPRGRNAGLTLLWMACILATLFLGITYLAGRIHAVPSEAETVISQIARTTFEGRGGLYLAAIAATTLILIMAANTAYNGFPRLAALQAGDGFLPRQLTYRGSRLVYSRGIVVLAVLASLLIWAFDASVSGLMPLYAIGVFLSFTLSQAGMARRWWKIGRLRPDEERRERASVLRPQRHAGLRLALNAVGALLTAIVTGIFAVTKFHDGAWVVVIVIPALVAFFFAIHRHYRDLATRLSLDDFGAPPRLARHRVILCISGVHRGTVNALRYARVLSDDITAVYVSTDPANTEIVQRKWGQWGSGVRLVIVNSPYRLLLEPLLDYIKQVADRRQPNEVITIVVPQFVPRKRWHELLHAQTAVLLRLALLFRPGIVITNVPYRLGVEGEVQ
jgi:amino acid transporter